MIASKAIFEALREVLKQPSTMDTIQKYLEKMGFRVGSRTIYRYFKQLNRLKMGKVERVGLCRPTKYQLK